MFNHIYIVASPLKIHTIEVSSSNPRARSINCKTSDSLSVTVGPELVLAASATEDSRRPRILKESICAALQL